MFCNIAKIANKRFITDCKSVTRIKLNANATPTLLPCGM